MRAVAAFMAYFSAAKIGLYFYYSFATSPALIWPAAGVSIIAFMLGGYRMWLPLFLAQYLALISEIPNAQLISLIIAAAFTLQGLVALWITRLFRSNLNIGNLKNAIVLISIAFGVTLIEPLVATLVQIYMHTLTVPPFFNFARAWGGGIFGVLTTVPLFITWYQPEAEPPKDSRWKLEVSSVFLILILLNHLLFWTSYPALFGISVIFFLPIVLMWVVLRLSPKWLSLSIFLTAISGIAGTLLKEPGLIPVNQQLLNIEVYISMVAAIFLIFASVVERRRANYLELEQTYLTASATEQAQNEFIAILAHELRNPLAPVVSSIELLKLQPQNAESRVYLNTAEAHLVMVRRLLDNLLETARLTQNSMELRKEIFNIKDIVDLSVRSVDDLIEARNHRFELIVPEEDVMIEADPVRIKQVLINILNNASKYTEHGGHITLELQETREFILVRVRDTGMGINPTEIKNIFKPFHQVRASGGRIMGLGIGLYITKNVVELHQGRIQVESEGLGKGSVFNIYLPRPSDETLSQVRESNQRIGIPAPRKILLVDDNQSAANTLAKLLSHFGHNVKVAYSGKSALEILHTFDPQAIFLDIGMPDMDGIEVAKQIRARGWQGKLIALSGYGQESDKEASHQAGFNQHLVKPVRTPDLLKALDD